jgi:ABC-type siderophore export system fused ATPase/permease subunit
MYRLSMSVGLFYSFASRCRRYRYYRYVIRRLLLFVVYAIISALSIVALGTKTVWRLETEVRVMSLVKDMSHVRVVTLRPTRGLTVVRSSVEQITIILIYLISPQTLNQLLEDFYHNFSERLKLLKDFGKWVPNNV